MSSWNYGGSSSSNPIEDEPVIPDIVEEFTFDDFMKTMQMIKKLFQFLLWITIPMGKSNYKNACNSIQKR